MIYKKLPYESNLKEDQLMQAIFILDPRFSELNKNASHECKELIHSLLRTKMLDRLQLNSPLFDTWINESTDSNHIKKDNEVNIKYFNTDADDDKNQSSTYEDIFNDKEFLKNFVKKDSSDININNVSNTNGKGTARSSSSFKISKGLGNGYDSSGNEESPITINKSGSHKGLKSVTQLSVKGGSARSKK